MSEVKKHPELISREGKRQLTLGLFYTSMAKKCFEGAAYDSRFGIKAIMNQYIAKCKAIVDHIGMSCGTANGQANFRREVQEGDTLQLANIMELYLEMNATERDTFETMVSAIKQGHQVNID
jgi:hypothetical protein